MSEISNLTQKIYTDLNNMMANPPSIDGLNAMLRQLAKWRSQVIINTFVKNEELVVRTGPFMGLKILGVRSEGAWLARALGIYEESLHPIIEEIIATDYKNVFDVGSAEGYYALGFALRMPKSKIYAFDTNEDALTLLKQGIKLNNFTDRINIKGLCTADDFRGLDPKELLVFCDIEGDEIEFLDKVKIPALEHADILVETHPEPRKNATKILVDHFQDSHDIILVNRIFSQKINEVIPGWFHSLNDLDRMLVAWEWRGIPTPWLWMRAKSKKNP